MTAPGKYEPCPDCDMEPVVTSDGVECLECGRKAAARAPQKTRDDWNNAAHTDEMVKVCPICGKVPIMRTEDTREGCNIGYSCPGHYTGKMAAEKVGHLARKSWNNAVDGIPEGPTAGSEPTGLALLTTCEGCKPLQDIEDTHHRQVDRLASNLEESRRELSLSRQEIASLGAKAQVLEEAYGGMVKERDKLRKSRDEAVADAQQVRRRLPGKHAEQLWDERGDACDCAQRALEHERSEGREPDERSWDAVAVSRRYADGDATDDELDAAWAAAWALVALGIVSLGSLDHDLPALVRRLVEERDDCRRKLETTQAEVDHAVEHNAYVKGHADLLPGQIALRKSLQKELDNAIKAERRYEGIHEQLEEILGRADGETLVECAKKRIRELDAKPRCDGYCHGLLEIDEALGRCGGEDRMELLQRLLKRAEEKERDKWMKLAYDVSEALRAPATVGLLDCARARMQQLDELRKERDRYQKRCRELEGRLARIRDSAEGKDQ